MHIPKSQRLAPAVHWQLLGSKKLPTACIALRYLCEQKSSLASSTWSHIGKGELSVSGDREHMNLRTCLMEEYNAVQLDFFEASTFRFNFPAARVGIKSMQYPLRTI